ncbi:MAG: M67 family metallopeptidase [Syntrophobacteraceae bacterium]|jgi:proteasome lid subunit RPN8/RPN11
MLLIPRHIYTLMIKYAREDYPVEACGILGGNEQCVVETYRMTNTDGSHEHFMMEPREQFAVAKDLRAKGLEILAVYHSHPLTPARPSVEDIRLAVMPRISHVIISLAIFSQPDVRSFRIADGQVSPEELRIAPE